MAKLNGLYVEITGICNERCPYCYNAEMVNEAQSLSLDIICKLFDEAKSLGISAVTLSGGEPFLHNDIHDIMKYADKINLGLLIISNGTCFEEKNIPFLVELNPSLQLTLDGWDANSHDATRGEGNFNKVTNGVRAARRAGYRGIINLRINLSSYNIGNFELILDMLSNHFELDNSSNLDINTLNVAQLVKSDPNSEFDGYLLGDDIVEFSSFFAVLEKWHHTVEIKHDFFTPEVGCAYNSSSDNLKCGLRIAADGNAFPCQMFSSKQFCLGNVFSQSIQDILYGENMTQFSESILSRSHNIDSCNQCTHRRFCFGGCPATAFIENGTILSVSSSCKLRKYNINRNLRSKFSRTTN